MKSSTSDDIHHDISRHVAYINMGGERWRHLEVGGERSVTCRTVVEISSFEGNFSFRGVWRPACLEKDDVVACIASVSLRDFITHHRIKAETKCFGISCRIIRCTVPNMMKIGQEIAVLFSSFRYKTRVTFQSFVIAFLPVYIHLFKKAFGHMIYSRQHHQTVPIKWRSELR